MSSTELVFTMHLKQFAFLVLAATALSGCNDTLDSSAAIDISKVKNKVEHPLSERIVAEMKAKDMDRNAPIMIRVFKEEGILEIWKAKTDNRFDRIAQYEICAWSGRLGPKVKEGDRQAPEGFYNLTPAHLNPNSSYYLAINTGFPNRYDQANGRTGTNLMIHGACSSSGCYSMTDAQVLEIYAFARDAFKGGQKAVQFQAFPFRMTAENMVRHRLNKDIAFWKMLKVGYDHFEVTKRPPEVNVCDRKYVFNQQTQGGTFNASAACPAMTTPPALEMALASYAKTYDAAYAKAASKYEGMAWYDPTEAERKAIVADKRKGRELAFAPTGSALKAGKLLKETEFAALMANQSAPKPTAQQTPLPAEARRAMVAAEPTVLPPVVVTAAAPVAPAPRGAPATVSVASSTAQAATTATVPVAAPATGQQNPLAFAGAPTPEQDLRKKPFWKFWSPE